MSNATRATLGKSNTNNNVDLANYKGIYYNDQNQKYQDEVTGAHFNYHDMCRRLNELISQRVNTSPNEVNCRNKYSTGNPQKDPPPHHIAITIESKASPAKERHIPIINKSKVKPAFQLQNESLIGSKKPILRPVVSLSKSRISKMSSNVKQQNATFESNKKSITEVGDVVKSRNQVKTACKTQALVGDRGGSIKLKIANSTTTVVPPTSIKAKLIDKIRPRSQIGNINNSKTKGTNLSSGVKQITSHVTVHLFN